MESMLKMRFRIHQRLANAQLIYTQTFHYFPIIDTLSSLFLLFYVRQAGLSENVILLFQYQREKQMVQLDTTDKQTQPLEKTE